MQNIKSFYLVRPPVLLKEMVANDLVAMPLVRDTNSLECVARLAMLFKR